MRNFFRFAYHSTDDRVILGLALILLGLVIIITTGIVGLGVWIGGRVGFMFVVVTLASITCGIGCLLIEDARKAQIGDNAEDDA